MTGILVGYALMAGAVAAVASGLYLLRVPDQAIWITSGAVLLVAAVAGIYLGAWIYMSLEVAPNGQTNLVRTIRFGSPLVIGFILTGLAKLLYG